MVISNLGANPLVLQIPIGSEDQFKVGTTWVHPAAVAAVAGTIAAAATAAAAVSAVTGLPQPPQPQQQQQQHQLMTQQQHTWSDRVVI